LLGWAVVCGTAGAWGMPDSMRDESEGSSNEMYLEYPVLPGEPFFLGEMGGGPRSIEYSQIEGKALAQAPPTVSQTETCDWEQVAASGFMTEGPEGSMRNDYAWAMSTYTDPQGEEWLYVGTLYLGNSQFTDPYNPASGVVVASGQAQVWRSSTGDQGDWEHVITLVGCDGVRGMTSYAGLLWLGTLRFSEAGGCELWATDGTNWKLANEPGFGVGAMSTRGITVYRGELYADAGQKDTSTSAEIFKYIGSLEEGNLDSVNPASWQSVASEGLVWIDPVNSIGVMKEFQGDLYVGTWSRGIVPSVGSDLGCDVYRYRGEDDVWERVAENGWGDPGNAAILSGTVFKDQLYLGATGLYDLTGQYRQTSPNVWRTSNGEDWEAVTTRADLGPRISGGGGGGGRGGGGGTQYFWSMTVFEDYLLIGTFNYGQGCEIWASKSGDPYSFVRINIPGMEPGRDLVPIYHPAGCGGGHGGHGGQDCWDAYLEYYNEQFGVRNMLVFEDKLYVGTADWAFHTDLIFREILAAQGAELVGWPHSLKVGCEVWRIDHLPPAMYGVRANPEDERVELCWSPYRQPGFDLAGYNVYRLDDPSLWEDESSHRQRRRPGQYQRLNDELIESNCYSDLDLTNFLPYHYQVTAVNTCGIETYYSDALAVIPGIPQETFWVYPNPFRPNDYDANTGTWEEGITFELINYPGLHQVKIYTLTGELVVETQDTDWIDEGGRLLWQWKARNENGDKVASGLYFFSYLWDGGAKKRKNCCYKVEKRGRFSFF